MSPDLFEQIESAVGHIRAAAPLGPQVGIILGSGLGPSPRRCAVPWRCPTIASWGFPSLAFPVTQGGW